MVGQSKPSSITLSRSQTWFLTCRRQVRAISTCRHSSNLVADRFRPYSITLSCSLACLRPARELVATSSRAGRRPAGELDSVMEFGLYSFQSATVMTKRRSLSNHLAYVGSTRQNHNLPLNQTKNNIASINRLFSMYTTRPTVLVNQKCSLAQRQDAISTRQERGVQRK